MQAFKLAEAYVELGTRGTLKKDLQQALADADRVGQALKGTAPGGGGLRALGGGGGPGGNVTPSAFSKALGGGGPGGGAIRGLAQALGKAPKALGGALSGALAQAPKVFAALGGMAGRVLGPAGAVVGAGAAAVGGTVAAAKGITSLAGAASPQVATELEKSWAMLMQSLGRAFLQPAAAINRALQGISSGFNAIPKEFWGAIWDTLGQALTGVGVALGKLLGAVDTVVASLLAGIDNLSRAANTPIGRALFKATTLGLSGPPALTDLHGDYQRGKKMVGGILAKGMEAARNPLTGTATQQPAFAGIADFGKQLQISALGQSPQDAEKARLDRENNELWREMNRGIKKIADKDGPMAP